MSIYNSCVYFTTYSGQADLPPFYIGSVYLQRIHEENYHGSVSSKKYKSIWEQEIKDNPHLFHTEIVSLHKTRKEAYIVEEQYQRAENVVLNPLYVNESIANRKFDCTGIKRRPESIRKGINTRKKNGWNKNPQETKQRQRAAAKNRLVTPETRKKLSEVKKGKIPWNKGRKIGIAKNAKAVLCVELNRSFSSCRDAAIFANLKRGAPDIANVCKGYRISAGGYTWRFI